MQTKSYTATEARKHFFELVKSAVEGQQIHQISHRQGSVVMLSEEEYDGMLETLELLSTSGFKESIQRSLQQVELGETKSLDDIFKEDD